MLRVAAVLTGFIRAHLVFRHRIDAFARSGPLNIAGLAQALAKRTQNSSRSIGRFAVQEPDYRHGGLLRARGEWPGSRAAEKRDELAPVHSITSSASSRNASGIDSPNALAVLRLTRSANVVGCTTGKSAGSFRAPVRNRHYRSREELSIDR
jgi:hypothetical protein